MRGMPMECEAECKDNARLCMNCTYGAVAVTAPPCRECFNTYLKINWVLKPVAPVVAHYCMDCVAYNTPSDNSPCRDCYTTSERPNFISKVEATPSCDNCTSAELPVTVEPCRSCHPHCRHTNFTQKPRADQQSIPVVQSVATPDLLEESIVHWRKIEHAVKNAGLVTYIGSNRYVVGGTEVCIGMEKCALCKKYFHQHVDHEDCGACPIRIKTGRNLCEGTPWSSVRDALNNGNLIDICVAVTNMCEFLKSLCPIREGAISESPRGECPTCKFERDGLCDLISERRRRTQGTSGYGCYALRLKKHEQELLKVIQQWCGDDTDEELLGYAAFVESNGNVAAARLIIGIVNAKQECGVLLLPLEEQQ